MVNVVIAKEISLCQILWLVMAKDGVIIISHVLRSCISYNEDLTPRNERTKISEDPKANFVVSIRHVESRCQHIIVEFYSLLTNPKGFEGR